ncbi:MAG: hypothetical protein CL521_02030 [Actinobacteria bacterium]|nr:hypothetical protein [Actinomycetota bacterium]
MKAGFLNRRPAARPAAARPVAARPHRAKRREKLKDIFLENKDRVFSLSKKINTDLQEADWPQFQKGKSSIGKVSSFLVKIVEGNKIDSTAKLRDFYEILDIVFPDKGKYSLNDMRLDRRIHMEVVTAIQGIISQYANRINPDLGIASLRQSEDDEGVAAHSRGLKLTLDPELLGNIIDGIDCAEKMHVFEQLNQFINMALSSMSRYFLEENPLDENKIERLRIKKEAILEWQAKVTSYMFSVSMNRAEQAPVRLEALELPEPDQQQVLRVNSDVQALYRCSDRQAYYSNHLKYLYLKRAFVAQTFIEGLDISDQQRRYFNQVIQDKAQRRIHSFFMNSRLTRILNQKGVLARLVSCFKDESRFLDLSKLGLTTLDLPWGVIDQLNIKPVRAINLNFNQFEEIPSVLGQMRVTKINLAKNQLKGSIPVWLEQRKDLEDLDFSFNPDLRVDTEKVAGLPKEEFLTSLHYIFRFSKQISDYLLYVAFLALNQEKGQIEVALETVQFRNSTKVFSRQKEERVRITDEHISSVFLSAIYNSSKEVND